MRDDALGDLLVEFVAEARERIARVEADLLSLADGSASDPTALLRRARRELHTIKGNAGMLGLEQLRLQAHRLVDEVDELDPRAPRIESLLRHLDELVGGVEAVDSLGAGGVVAARPATVPADAGPLAGGSLRVASARIDALLDLQADQVVLRHRLGEALARTPPGEEAAAAWEALERNLEQVKDGILGLGVVPVGSIFGALKRIVHDEARAAGKSVRLTTRGDRTALDKELVEFASEALGHLVRNAVVHGIEPAVERRERGKPEVGTVRVDAGLRSDAVHIEVADDGAGIDREALAEAASRAGLRALDGEDLQALVFLPGLSTRRTADLRAGRGIALAAVAEEAHRLGGAIDVSSEPGAGSIFRLRLPLSTSIIRALLVSVDGEDYALPVSAVIETLRLRPGETGGDAQTSTPWRGLDLPLLDLGLAFATATRPRASGSVVVLESEGRLRGMTVDATGELLQIVVKGLDPVMRHPPGVSGSTVLGDGRIVLILDPSSLTTLVPRAEIPA